MAKYIKNLEESMQSILNEGIADDLAKLLGIEKDEAANIVSGLTFSEYLELGNAVDVEDREAAMDILDYAGPVEEDAMDERGKMCPVCSGGRREGYSNDCPNCAGEGYVDEATIAQYDAWANDDIDADAEALINKAIERCGDDCSAENVIRKIKTGWSGLNPATVNRAIEFIKNDSIVEDNKLLDKPTPTLGELAKKHNVPLGEIGAQLATGIKIELEHTNDRAIAKEIALDHLNELPDYYDRLKSVEEADNPFTPITPPSEQMPSSTVAQGGEEESDIGRMDVEDLRTGDDIEVIDIDGEPVAVTVKNPRGPGDTLVVQTDKGEEHMVKKQAVSGTPKMESLKQMYEAAMSDTKFDVVLSSDDMESKAAEGVSMKDALRAAEQQLQMFHDIAIQGDGDPDSINVQRTTYRPNVNGAPMRLPEWMIQDEVTRDISYLVIKPAEAIEEKGRWTRIKNSDKKLGQKINRAERIEKKKKLDHVDEGDSIANDWEGDICTACNGAGSEDMMNQCEVCDGHGRVNRDVCPDCDGKGTPDMIHMCDTCQGYGSVKKARALGRVEEEFHNNIVDGEGDRVETPLGTGTVLAVQKTERGDVLARVQLDDYEDADGDTFTFPSLQLKRLVDEADRTRSAQADFLNIKIPVSAKSKNTRTYLPRSIRAILKDHGVEITGKTRVSAADDSIFGGGGVVVRISGLEFPNKGMGMQKLAKDIYDKLNFAGYNVEDYPTFVQSGVNVFVNNWGEEDTPRWNIDEAADKVKPFNKMGYAPKAGSWKKRMHKAQPPENHEKTKKRHKKLREEDPEGAEERKAFKKKLRDPTQYYIRREYNIGKTPYRDFKAEILDGPGPNGGYKVRFTDDKGEEDVRWYPAPGEGALSGRFYDERLLKAGEKGRYVGGDSRANWPAAGEGMNESDIEMLKLPDDYKPAPKPEPHILDKYDWTMYLDNEVLGMMDSFIHKMKSQNVWDKGVELAGGEEELLRSIQYEAEDVVESYRGTGEGIGTSDINHFVRSIFRDLGEDDIWGWDKKDVEEGYRVMPDIDRERYTEIDGLEGPFQAKNGAIYYYDPREGKYYDRDRDMYISDDEFRAMDEGVTEGWPQEETHAEMVEYWKQSLSQSIVRKGVFTQMYDAANNDIEELNAAIADQAESIADSYHGSGEGIGSSDQNHFIYNIAQQLGIKDVFGWRTPKIASDEEMERAKAVRGMKASKAIRNAEGIEEELQFFVDPQGQGANVMNNKGEVHDYYDDPHQARQEAERLNNEYGEVDEARNASNTEHSGAKKGKGGYYGRKKDAKSDSNKARRENDKKAVDEDVARIRKLAGIQETASGGATGAGAVAVGAVATGGMQSRNPSIYGQATKPKRKKRKTKEEKSDGIGRDRKE